MPSVEIIAIGTELLLGEIQDSNTRYLAKALRNINVDLFRSTIIGDNPARISDLIKEALSRADIIITSGGLGPTVDDPTRLAVAQAVDVELVFITQLWDQIIERFKRYGRAPTENNRRQAYIPQNAVAIENPVGTAPAFIVEIGGKCIISLPGVPHELEYLLENRVIPYLVDKYSLIGVIKVKVLHTAGLGESIVDEQVADLERLSNPTVGLLAHPGQTDIRITAKAESEKEAEDMITPIRATIMERLGITVFGEDTETLESTIPPLLNNRQLKIYESGLSDYLAKKLINSVLMNIPLIHQPASASEIFDAQIKESAHLPEQIFLGMLFSLKSEWPSVHIIVVENNRAYFLDRTYGGPGQNAPSWAFFTALDFLRRTLITNAPQKDKDPK